MLFKTDLAVNYLFAAVLYVFIVLLFFFCHIQMMMMKIFI